MIHFFQVFPVYIRNTDFYRYLPLIPNFTNPAPYDQEVVEHGKTQSLDILDKLEEQMGQNAYLVGDSLTLADIFLAIFISRGLEWVLGAEWREAHPNIMRHFSTFADTPEVKKLVPHFILIDKETANMNPYTVGISIP
jgi:elongation factor 1-gamma